MARSAARGAALLVFAVVLSGCVAATQEPGPGQLAVVADRTAEAGTARMTMVMTSTASPADLPDSELRMEGVANVAEQAVRATLELDLPWFPAGDEVERFRGEVIVVDGVQYLGGGIVALSQEDLGHPWLAMPAPAVSAGSPLAGARSQAAPIELLARLGRLGGAASIAGEDEVRGVAVTHWRVETTSSQLLRARVDHGLTAEEDELLREGWEHLAEVAAELEVGPLTDPVIVEVWADADDLLRRLRIQSDHVDEGADAGAFRTVLDLELYDHGVEAAIGAPPDAVVVRETVTSGAWPAGREHLPLAGPRAWTRHTAGSPLPGVSGALANLPYPADAERLQTTADQVRYIVPVLGEDPTSDLAAFYQGELPDHGWVITGSSSAEPPRPDGTFRQTVTLEVSGHDRTGLVHIIDDRSHQLSVTLTLE